MTKCHCLMADDHPVVRRGVRDLLEAEGLCSKVHEVGSGQDALEAIRQAPWDLLILDVALPDVHGLEVLKEAKRIQPSLPVLMLSLYPEKEFALRAIKSGASGYLTKESAPSELVVAVRQILKKGRYITASLADQLAMAFEYGETGSSHASLSDREMQVLRLLGKGKPVSVIAADLHLSVKTVSTYRARILEKLSCQNTAELIRYALDARLAD